MSWFLRGVAVFALSSCFVPPEPGPPLPPASAGRFTIECAERAVRAYDATRTVIDGVPIACTVHLALRNGEPATGRSITVLAEAGRFTIDPATSAEGSAALRLETGTPVPLDVAPTVFTHVPLNDPTHTGELVAPMWMAPYEWTETLVPTSNFSLREPRRADPVRLKPDGTRFENNPRDNLVTIMAWTEGQEAFGDVNANGTFDVGEIFTDLTEPFLDSDDDGTRGPEEQFVDTNGNGQWDGKNGQWDHQTKIWTQQRVLWTGVPADLDVQRTVQGLTGHRPTLASLPSSLNFSCPSGPTTCAAATLSGQSAGPANVTFRILDPWFNRLAHEGLGDGCSLASSPLITIAPARIELGPSDVWSANEFHFTTIADARDPMMPTMKRSPPQSFVVNFVCDLSARRGQPAERFTFNGLSGTIE